MINSSSDIERYSDIETKRQSSSFISFDDFQRTELVSLGLALDKLNYRLSGVTQIIDDNSILNLDEINSIRFYTKMSKPKSQSIYNRLTKALRSSDRNQISPYFSYLKILINGLSKIKSTKTIGWRVSNIDLHDEYQIGEVFIWQSFSSCVESLEYLESNIVNMRTLFCIEFKTGKYISNYLDDSSSNEYLLFPGSEFEIVRKGRNSKNVPVIYLKERKSIFGDEFEKKKVEIQPRKSVDLKGQRENFLSNSSFFKKKSTNQNRSLEKFLFNERKKSSIRFPETPLTMNDMELIRESIVENYSWTTVYMWKTFLEEKYLSILLSGIEENSKIICLNLDYNRLGDTGACLMADFLQTNESLRNVYLKRNQIGSIGAQSFADMLKFNSTLTYLGLSENSLCDQGIIALSEALTENQTLISINLSQTSMTHKGLKHLAEALQSNKTLTILKLADNNIADQGLEILLRGLSHNSTLLTVDLSKNNITQRGALSIKQFFIESKRNLINLFLSDNPLGNVGVKSILSAFRVNSTLEKIKLDSTGINKNLIEDLSEFLKINNQITHIDLSRNSLGDIFITFLVDVLEKNKTLKHLNLNEVEITDQSLSSFIEILMKTKTLNSIELVKNHFSEETRQTLETVRQRNQPTLLYFEFTFDTHKSG